jgi:hypothetical protein
VLDILRSLGAEVDRQIARSAQPDVDVDDTPSNELVASAARRGSVGSATNVGPAGARVGDRRAAISSSDIRSS